MAQRAVLLRPVVTRFMLVSGGLILLLAAGVATGHAQAPEDEPFVLTGTLRIGAEPAPMGVAVSISDQVSGQECGVGATSAGGRFSIPLPDCLAGAQVFLTLLSTGDVSPPQTLVADLPLDFTFSELSAESLERLGLAPPEDAAEEPTGVLTGIISIESEPVREATTFSVSVAGSGLECGRSATTAGGRYSVPIVGCAPGEMVFVTLLATGDASDAGTLPLDEPFDVSFDQLSAASKALLQQDRRMGAAIVSGQITLGEDGALPAGQLIQLIDSESGELCGSVGSTQGGLFTMTLTGACASSTMLVISLPAADLVSDPNGAGEFNIDFPSASQEQLVQLGVRSALEEQVLEQAAESADATRLTGESPLIALGIILGGSGLLLVYMTKKKSENPKVSFNLQVEALVLVDVLGALLLLGLSEKIGDQGLVSISSAVAGYAIARGGAEIARRDRTDIEAAIETALARAAGTGAGDGDGGPST